MTLSTPLAPPTARPYLDRGGTGGDRCPGVFGTGDALHDHRQVGDLADHGHVVPTQVLLRTTRRQRVTEFGLEMLEYARQVAAQVDAASALNEHRQIAPSGRLRVSMPGDLALLTLVEGMAAFSARHPAIELELDLSPRRVDLLGEGYDLALRPGELPDDRLLAARRLTVFTRGLYAAPGYLAERGGPASPEDLARFDALRLQDGRGGVQTWFLANGKQSWEGLPAGRITANSPELLIRLACAGSGIAAVPDLVAAPSVRRGELTRVLPAWSLQDVEVASRVEPQSATGPAAAIPASICAQPAGPSRCSVRMFFR